MTSGRSRSRRCRARSPVKRKVARKPSSVRIVARSLILSSLPTSAGLNISSVSKSSATSRRASIKEPPKRVLPKGELPFPEGTRERTKSTGEVRYQHIHLICNPVGRGDGTFCLLYIRGPVGAVHLHFEFVSDAGQIVRFQCSCPFRFGVVLFETASVPGLNCRHGNTNRDF